jgi:OOP family OmpA-OmpF porin
MKMNVISGVIGAALFAMGMCAAQAESGPYVGANFGQSSIDLCSGLAVTGCDDDDTGWKVYGGYDINPYFAVEAGYADLGDFSVAIPGITVTGEYDGMFIDAKGSLPIGDAFSVFAKLGVLFWDVEGANAAVGYSEDGSDLSYGLGAEYMFTSQFGGRAEWQQFQDVDGDDVTLWTGGAVFKF